MLVKFDGIILPLQAENMMKNGIKKAVNPILIKVSTTLV